MCIVKIFDTLIYFKYLYMQMYRSMQNLIFDEYALASNYLRALSINYHYNQLIRPAMS